MIRPGSVADADTVNSVHCIYGDMRDKYSLRTACDGVDYVIATASVVFPTRRVDKQSDEAALYNSLIEVCLASSVKLIVFISVLILPDYPNGLGVPLVTSKLRIEDYIKASGLDYCILRCAPFMEDYFSLVGSAIPLAGEINATLHRARRLTKTWLYIIGEMIERFGIAIVPGSKDRSHAFISIRDVARVVVEALGTPTSINQTFNLFGPQSLQWRDVCDIYEELLDNSVKIITVPAALIMTLEILSIPISMELRNQLSILRYLCQHDFNTAEFGGDLHSIIGSLSGYDFLSEKVVLWMNQSDLKQDLAS